MKLPSASGPLEHVVMHIFGRLQKTAIGNKFLIWAMDSYKKQYWTVPSSKITATQAASLLVDLLVVTYRTPSLLLTDKPPEFVSKFFKTLCTFLG